MKIKINNEEFYVLYLVVISKDKTLLGYDNLEFGRLDWIELEQVQIVDNKIRGELYIEYDNEMKTSYISFKKIYGIENYSKIRESNKDIFALVENYKEKIRFLEFKDKVFKNQDEIYKSGETIRYIIQFIKENKKIIQDNSWDTLQSLIEYTDETSYEDMKTILAFESGAKEAFEIIKLKIDFDKD